MQPKPAPSLRLPRPGTLTAFTLVELLAVIAIIGVLVAILIPVVGSVRKSAQTANCANNLRQIGVAFHLYAQNNRGLLPMPLEQGKTWPENRWMYKINPYLEAKRSQTAQDDNEVYFGGIFRCPGKPDWRLAGGDAYKISYGMSAFDANNQGESSKYLARQVNTLTHPAITMLVMDRATFSPAGNPTSVGTEIINSMSIYQTAVGLWHKGNDNVLFVDGHVEPVPRGGLNYYLMKTANNNLRPW